MSQVIPEKPLRVVVWSTGTIGRHAIAGIDAHPDLELVGVWVSNPENEGKDAGELAELGRELGSKATNDQDALFALNPDAIVHTAMADGFGFVAMGRALLREPDLVNNLQAGRATEGVCIHCNRCMPTIYTGTRCVVLDPA